jgi:folylpolyglutamate synthase/dihydropteroate synthase
LCAFERNKKIKTTLKKYGNKFHQIICSETNIRNSMPAKEIAIIFGNKNNIIIEKHINNAMKLSIEKLKENDALVIIGSHFLGTAINGFFKNCFALDYKRILT